jgi:hypothetical protein
MMTDPNKPLYEYDARDLPDDQLRTLYLGLVAKLMLTCEELMRRNEGHAALCDTLIATDVLNVYSAAEKQKHRDNAMAYRQSAKRQRALHAALVTELSQINPRANRPSESTQ